MQSVSDLVGIAFDALTAGADRDLPENPGDYYGPDGLLMCGQCFTPKQCIVPLNIGGKVREPRPPCLCKCAAASREREEDERRIADELRYVEQLRAASLMTGRMKGFTFELFQRRPENERTHKLLRRYVDGFPEMLAKNQGLLLYGPVGGGKTFAAACIANALIEQRWSVLATSMVKLMQTDPFGDDDAFGYRAGKVSLMILDDLGAERNTDFALERVYGVIDGRSRAGKPLIVTTNLTLDQMQSADDVRYQRIYSRILETCYPVEVQGISWRMESAADRYDKMRQLLEVGEDGKEN